MKKLNALKLMPLLILSVLITNCAPKPPDVPVCEHLEPRIHYADTGHLISSPSPACMKEIGEPECGHCVYIVTGREVYIGEKEVNRLNGKTWSDLRNSSVLLPAIESYGPLAEYLINTCKQSNCSGDLTRFKVKLDSLKLTQ